MPLYTVTKSITTDAETPEDAALAFFRALDIEPHAWGDTVLVDSLDGPPAPVFVTVRRSEPVDTTAREVRPVDVLDLDTTAA